MRTLHTQSLTQVALPVDTRSSDGTVSGSTVDLGVFGNDFRTVLFVVHAGTVTDGTHTFSLEESTDGQDWSPVAARHVQGSPVELSDANDVGVHQFGYIVHTARYVRVSVEVADATTGGLYGAVAVCGGGSQSEPARA